MTQIALQMYSVRNYVQDDVRALFRKVRESGFEAVELAGFYGLKAVELRALLDEAGLRAISAHIKLPLLKDEPEKTAEDARVLGLEAVVLPHAPTDSEAEIRETAAVLNHFQRVARPFGIRVGYHNHEKEFRKIRGEYILDCLLREFDEPEMFIELDTCWAAFGGVEPAAYLRSLGQRTGPVHLKELSRGYDPSDRTTVDEILGQGLINFPAVIETLRVSGALSRGLIIEQEGFRGDPFEALAAMYRYVKGLTAPAAR